MDVKDLKKLESKGFYFVKAKSEYEVARMSGPCTIILYNTGKISVQGKQEITDKIKSELGLQMKITEKSGDDRQTRLSETIVGSDETLKGDTFGGIVVAGFRADNDERKKLLLLGVKDSKQLDDGTIMSIARKIKEFFPKNYFVVELKPLEYNELNSLKNVTKMLDDLHREVNKKLKTNESMHVVDKYPGCKVGDITLERAESKYPEVAAASIIARDVAIKQINELSRQAGFIIPKGSSHVEKALKKIKRLKLKPQEFVKINFNNVKSTFY